MANPYYTPDDSIPIIILPPDPEPLIIESSYHPGSSPLPVNWDNHSSPFPPHLDLSTHAPYSPPSPQISSTAYGENHGDDIFLSQPITTTPWNDSLGLTLSEYEQYDRPLSPLEPTSITTSFNDLTLSSLSPTLPAVCPEPKIFDQTFSPSLTRTPNPYYNNPAFDGSVINNGISASSSPQIRPSRLFVDTDVPSSSIPPSSQPSYPEALFHYNPWLYSPSIAHPTPSPLSTPSPYSPSSVFSAPSPCSGSGHVSEESHSEDVCGEGTHQPSHGDHLPSTSAHLAPRPVLGRRSHSEGRSHIHPGMPCSPPQSHHAAMEYHSSTSLAIPNFPNFTNSLAFRQCANNPSLSPDAERFSARRGRGDRRSSTSTPGSRMGSPYARRDGSSPPNPSDPRAGPERPPSHRASNSESSFLMVPDFLESWSYGSGGLGRRHSHSGSRPDMRPDSDTTHSSLGSLAGRRRSATDHSHLDQFRQGLMFESQGSSSGSTPAEDQSSYHSAYDQQSIRARVTSDATLEASTARRKNAATFSCPICGNQLTAKHNLDRHIRAHMGKRPFKCPCGQSFTSKSDCTRHQRNSQQSSCIAEQPSSQEIQNPPGNSDMRD